MIPPYHLRATSLRPEEVLVESARERLVVQARREEALAQAGTPRQARDVLPPLILVAALGAIARWFLTLA